MVDIIENLLALSRMSRLKIERTPVDLSNVARDVSDEILESHRGRRIRFDIEVGVKANADPKLMRTVLENLFDNATKYSSRESFAEITFGRRNQDGRAVYYVSDNGVGFDEADSSMLFVPFQRLHGETEFSGTGIGLATVARIVERHGGQVWAESVPGDGAAFYFTLQGN